jgi:uncharacterized protein YbcC (UPF0753/DUF2309 family)
MFAKLWNLLKIKLGMAPKQLPPSVEDVLDTLPVPHNMFASILLEEARERIKVEKEFIHSDKFMKAVRHAIKHALREPNKFIGYMDLDREVDDNTMPIFCELMVRACRDNNVQAKSIDNKYIEINADSLQKLLKEIQDAERSACIDDTLKGMFQTGIYR